MARLLINPGTPEAWELPLPPGRYLLGRNEENDFQIPYISVSGRHCELVVDDAGALIRDLGSSNGTFVDRAPVTEARLQPGQQVRLGSVEMIYDAGTSGAGDESRPKLHIAKHEPAPATAEVPLPPRISERKEPLVMGAVFCKFHPKSPAGYLCRKCNHYFCSQCVTTRNTSAERGQFCRKCGSELVSVQARGIPGQAARGFFAQLPGAFLYPLRGWGAMIIVIGAMVFAVLHHLGGILKLTLGVTATGYLFAYMQNIIHSTAAGDKELPDLPELTGLLGEAFSLFGTILICFGPALLLAYLAIGQEQPWAGVAMIPAMIAGGIYFPMAFLVVAMKDTVVAANPLVVVPSILRVPLEYAVAVVVMGGVFGFKWLGDLVMDVSGHEAVRTTSVSAMVIIFVLQIVWSLVGVYLLSVNMRILGLLYATKQDELGWF